MCPLQRDHGQRAVDARYHELEKITDPQQRAEAEKLLRAHADKPTPPPRKPWSRPRPRQAQWKGWLHSLGENNPARAAGEKLYSTIERRQNRRIAANVVGDARQDRRPREVTGDLPPTQRQIKKTLMDRR